MTSQDGVMTPPAFAGSPEQQQLAEQVYKLMLLQGSLFAVDAPIRQTRNNLASYLAAQNGGNEQSAAKLIDEALQANPDVFARDEQGDDVTYTTSKLGSYRPRTDDLRHMFKQRLYEPENPLPIDDISVVVSTTRPALTTVEPVFISDYWQIQAGLVPVPRGDEEILDGEDLVEAEAAFVDQSEALAQPVDQGEQVAAVEEPVVEQEVVEPATVAAPAEDQTSTTIMLPDGVSIDLSRSRDQIIASYGPALEEALLASIDRDPLSRIVSFGRSIYPQASLVSLGKNDLRRIRDYIMEVGEPLLDTTIIADLYYHNPRQADYEGFRFSLNYRLSREKDFDFVGVEGARLWSTKGLPVVGTKRVKVSEMGQITSYLEEGYDDSLTDQSVDSIQQSGSVSRLLTFFEWEYGILPLDDSLEALLPKLMLSDQRSAVLRFESPQHYNNYLVEMRAPTGSRGGWLQGLEEFFHDHLVPGALITLSRTEEPNVFTITYEEANATDDRLLTLDEKKNKLAFTNVNYYVVVDEDQLISQQRFGKLRNLKLFPMAERRKADQMLEHVFETVGDQLGNRSEPLYWIKLDDLYVAANVLRPFSRAYLQALLGDDERYYADESAPGAYFYKPEQRQLATATDDDEEEEENIPTVRRGGRRYRDEDE